MNFKQYRVQQSADALDSVQENSLETMKNTAWNNLCNYLWITDLFSLVDVGEQKTETAAGSASCREQFDVQSVD